MACDKCYTKTGYIASGFCGCSNCDKCNRCCGIPPKCDSVSITWTVLVTGSESSPLTCCSASPLAMDKHEENNIYNQFFKVLKSYNKKIKNKNVIFQTNPLEMEVFKRIKFSKKNNENGFFDFSSNINKNYKNWNYHKQNINFHDFYNKNYNFAYWTGSKWIFLRNKNNFCFNKIDCKNPFYVIFDDFLEIVKTNNNFFDLNLKNICSKYVDSFIFVKNDIKIKNKKSTFFGNQDGYALSSGPTCECPKIGYCYSFSTTLTRSGDGCGFCSGQIPQPPCNFSIGTVGGGGISTTQFSDQWIAGVTLVYNNLLDGYDVNLGPYSTACGSLCIGEITGKASGCPLCHFNGNFRYNANYQKNLIENRKKNRNILNKKTSRKFI